jgi:hypothetical protein
MIFAPRKIMFQYQLSLWECNNDSWHESSLSTVSSQLKASNFKPTVSPWQSQIKLSAWPDVQQYISLVHDYAQRKLTYGDDALHAITSLLSVMSTSFIGGFISGLPEMFFDEALLWQPAQPMQKRRSSGRHDIPSWSWAGWEGDIMTTDWMHHFRHLYGNDNLLVGPASPTGVTRRGYALPGEGNPSNPVLPVSPKVTWFYGQTLLERFPIIISGQTYIKHLTDKFLPLPPGWSFSSSNYCFNNQESTASSFPLPISANQASRTVSARYIFSRTTRAYLHAEGATYSDLQHRMFEHNTQLQDTNGYCIGELNLNLTQTNFQATKEQTEFELVVISAGEFNGQVRVLKKAAHNEASDLHRIQLPDGFGWGEVYFDFPLGNDVDEHVLARIGLYHVLWIEWEDGIAYRKGLGRVLKKAWDQMETEEIDLVLG